MQANQQLKHECIKKLWDLSYAVIVHSTLQTSMDDENCTDFGWHLAMTFGGPARHGKVNINMWIIDAESQEVTMEANEKLSKFPPMTEQDQ